MATLKNKVTDEKQAFTYFIHSHHFWGKASGRNECEGIQAFIDAIGLEAPNRD